MVYLLDIMNTGGEFTYGFITNAKEKKLVKEKIKDDTLELENYAEDGSFEVNFFEYDQILHLFGPAIDDAKFSLTSYKDENLENEIKEHYYLVNNKKAKINTFSLSNPSLYDYEQKNGSLPKGSLIFGGFYVEKRIHFPIVIKLEDGEKYNSKFVYVGSVNLDETVSNDEIVSKAFYIRDSDAKTILDLYYGDKVDGNLFEDCISDILYYLDECQNHEEIQTIFDRCECEIKDIEGKGEREESYVIVKNDKDKLLYEKNY